MENEIIRPNGVIRPDEFPDILKPSRSANFTTKLENWSCGDIIIVRAVAENLTGEFGKCFVGVRFYIGDRKLRAKGGKRDGQCQFYERHIREYVFRFIIPDNVTRAELFVESAADAEIVIHELQVYTLPNSFRDTRKGGVKFVAHLGMIGYAPRNTFAAFALAANAGYSECVVNTNITADRKLVALHNDTIDETSDGHGSIRSMTLAEARKYDFGSWFDPSYHEELPLLDDVLRFMSHSGMRPVLRLGNFGKDQAIYNEIWNMVRHHGLSGRCTAKGFSRDGLECMARAAGNRLRYGYCCDIKDPGKSDEIDFVKSLGNDVYLDLCDRNLSEKTVDAALDRDVPVEAWIVNDFERIVRLADMGGRGFTTDYFPMEGCAF